MHREFVRFLLVGASNTLLSWLLFVILVRFIPYLAAYTLAYASGIMISYFSNVHFVFRERVSFSSFLKFPFVYLLQYTLGMLLMWLLIGRMDISQEFAMVVVVGLTIPITFFASRKILKRTPSSDGSTTSEL